MTIINADSFILTSTAADGAEQGTVEVTLRGQVRRVSACRMTKYNWLFAYDMIGRYQSGGKVWPAVVRQYVLNDKVGEDVSFGRDDRNPKFRKENCIWFK